MSDKEEPEIDDKEIQSELDKLVQLDLVAEMHAVLNDLGFPAPTPRSERETKLFNMAKNTWEVEGSIKFDDDAAVLASDKGAYVEAWLWVDDPEAK
jgi:hypothetical protein